MKNEDRMNIEQDDLLSSPIGAFDSASLGAVDDDWNNPAAGGGALLFSDTTRVGDTNEKPTEAARTEIWEEGAMEDTTEPIKYRPSTPPSPASHTAVAQSAPPASSTSNNAGGYRYSPKHGGLPWKENDVPLGRSQEVREFGGNYRYRGMVERNRPDYLKAVRRAEKTRITTSIYNDILSRGGRFLDKKLTKKKGGAGDNGAVSEEIWYEITQEKALAKISQALRMGTGSLTKSPIQHQQYTTATLQQQKPHPQYMPYAPGGAYPVTATGAVSGSIASVSMDTTPVHRRHASGTFQHPQQPMTPQRQDQFTGMTISVPQQQLQQQQQQQQHPFHFPPAYQGQQHPVGYPPSPLPSAVPTSPNVHNMSVTASPMYSPPNMMNLNISSNTRNSARTAGTAKTSGSTGLHPMVETEVTRIVKKDASSPIRSLARSSAPPTMPQFSAPNEPPMTPTNLDRSRLSSSQPDEGGGEYNVEMAQRPRPIDRHSSDSVNVVVSRRGVSRRTRRPRSFTTPRSTSMTTTTTETRRASSAVRPRDDSQLFEDDDWQHQPKKRLPTPPRKNSHESAPGDFFSASAELTLSSTAEEVEEEVDCQSDDQVWTSQGGHSGLQNPRWEGDEEDRHHDGVQNDHHREETNDIVDQGGQLDGEGSMMNAISSEDVELDFEPIPVVLDRNKPPFAVSKNEK